MTINRSILKLALESLNKQALAPAADIAPPAGDPMAGMPPGAMPPPPGAPAGTAPGGGIPVDPATGQPMDPTTGMPIDPATGQPIDPAAAGGAPVDPATGQPMDPAAAGGAPPPPPPPEEDPVMMLLDGMQQIMQQLAELKADSQQTRKVIDILANSLDVKAPVSSGIPTGEEMMRAAEKSMPTTPKTAQDGDATEVPEQLRDYIADMDGAKRLDAIAEAFRRHAGS